MLAEFGVTTATLHTEPWLDSFIKCDCLRVMCDDVAAKFADMLAINSVELGSVLRKLRLTFRQSFEQMHGSWRHLRQTYLDTSTNLTDSQNTIGKLRSDLESKEVEMNKHFDSEVMRLNQEFNAEKARDQEKILQTEFKMEQMSDTLKYLNGIFRTMQSDGATIKTVDLQAKCFRLEKDNETLQKQNASLDSVKAMLAKAEQRVKQLEKDARQQDQEINLLKLQLERREEAVKTLMEKEALRNAEIEKLQKISKLKDDELVAVDLKESSTSVLCIKCKKSLDDLSNIRSAILGDPNAQKGAMKQQCEAFRILLPNLKGRKPNRTTKWLRSCMRSILISKLKEDVHLHFIKGNNSRFPAFVYSWFVQKTNGRSGSQLTKLLMNADEDRWGLYYGVRALSKDDPEALVFWSLLDETYGQDGMQFVIYCLSVLLSIGGPLLWRQFGSAMESGANINVKPVEDKNVLDNVWIDIITAKEAVKLILVRALSTHVSDAVDAIDALKVRPSEFDISALYHMMREEKHSHHAADHADAAAAESSEGAAAGSEVAAAAEGAADADAAAVDGSPDATPPDSAPDSAAPESDRRGATGGDASGAAASTVPQTTPASQDPELEVPHESPRYHAFEETIAGSALLATTEPTHISLFMWLRLMMQQLHADQIQRAAAVRLMFETASVGALTPQTAYGGEGGGGGDGGGGSFGTSATHVEYPQFQSICQTLFPHVPTTETAMLYHTCFEAGQKRVNAEVFTKYADRCGLFAHALKLPSLPLLRQRNASSSQPKKTATTAGTAAASSSAEASVQHFDLDSNGAAMAEIKDGESEPQSELEPAVDSSVATTGQEEQQQLQVASASSQDKESATGASITNIFSLRTEQAVRSKLATMVHRKLAIVSPSIVILMQNLPERWRTIIAEAMDAVHVALQDSHQKLKQQTTEQLNNVYASSDSHDTPANGNKGPQEMRSLADEKGSQRTYIDGIQPFIAYRRLLLLSSLIKTLCDNPLLPTDLFSAADLDNKSPNIDQAMFRADKLLSSIEQGFILAPGSGAVKGNIFMGIFKRYQSFEMVRLTLIARRLQNVFRRFLAREVAVPRSVRLCMSPGYLGASESYPVQILPERAAAGAGDFGGPAGASSKFSSKAAFASTKARPPLSSASVKLGGPAGGGGAAGGGGGGAEQDERLFLRNREVYHEPWWGQAIVAEVYRYKLTYDSKAATLGLPPIRLAEAVVASHYQLWGTLDAAETMVHDLFVCVRSYRFGIPRLRLFAAFLGDGRDIEEPVAEMLRTPHAVSVYLNFLIELHREMQREKVDNQREQQGLLPLLNRGASELMAMGLESGSKDDVSIGSATTATNVINVLFPSTENVLSRHDKRDIWMCSQALLTKVVKLWAAKQPFVSSNGGAGGLHLYAELAEKLRPNPMEQVDVDDFLWLVMVQWAKIAQWNIKRATKLSESLEKQYLLPAIGNKKSSVKVKNNSASLTAALKSGAYGRHKILLHKSSFNTLPALPMSSLRTIVDSLYQPGQGGTKMPDAQYYGATYVRRIGTRRVNLKQFKSQHRGSSSSSEHTSTTSSNAETQDGNSGKGTDPSGGNEATKPRSTPFSQEMDVLMKECVLWDTNTLDDGYRNTLDMIAHGTAGFIPGMVENANQLQGDDGNSSGPFIVLMPFAPEMSYNILKQAFTAHQPAIKFFLEEVVEQLEEISAQVETKFQMANTLFVSLAEKFIEPERPCSTYRLFLHEADSSALRNIESPALRAALEHSHSKLPAEQLEKGYGTLWQNANKSSELWAHWQAMISTIAELAIATGREPPHDPWTGGMKMHVDRAFVYSIYTKQSPDTS